jgi:hypothetical protein
MLEQRLVYPRDCHLSFRSISERLMLGVPAEVIFGLIRCSASVEIS